MGFKASRRIAANPRGLLWQALEAEATSAWSAIFATSSGCYAEEAAAEVGVLLPDAIGILRLTCTTLPSKSAAQNRRLSFELSCKRNVFARSVVQQCRFRSNC